MGQEQKVIDTEKKYEGYLEKKNGDKRYLADKTANAGSNNYTIFWDILKPEWQGQPWCSAFQSACFLETYGEEKAQALLCGGLYSYYTPADAKFFKNKGQWVTSGYKPGDVCFFKVGNDIGHIGLIVEVNGNMVTTIEGNTSPSNKANNVVSNGGGVFYKYYTIPSSYLIGAGRPDYSILQPQMFAPSVTLNRAMAVTALFALCGKNKVDTAINFVDVPKGRYFYEPVKWAVRNGITVGASETKFNPFGYCTRAMFLQMMWRISGSPKVNVNLPFTDVDESSWYYDAVKWAYRHGIVSGVSDTEFAPNRSITRAEAAQMIYAAQGKPTVVGTMPFADVIKGKWYYDAVLFCKQNGIFSGIS